MASSLLATVILLMCSIPAPAQAAVITGQFRYADRGGLVAIRNAKVEIWYRENDFAFWGAVATITSNNFGQIAFTDARSTGTYYLRVYATNDAAVVYPVDWHTLPMSSIPGMPATHIFHRPTSASSVLDFSWDFTGVDAAFFNAAETLRIALAYVEARRDDTDPIPRVDVKPTSWTTQPATSYYSNVFRAIMTFPAALSSDWAMLHEYGHHIQYSISAGGGGGSDHDGCAARQTPGGLLINTSDHAFSEGFANYFAAAVTRMRAADAAMPDVRSYGIALETPPPCNLIGQMAAVGPITAGMVEDYVAAALWDLVDPPGNPAQGVEPFDIVSAEDTAIIQILDRELDSGWGGLPPTINMFRSAWSSRGKDLAGLDCILSGYGILAPTAVCRQSSAVKLTGDFDHDRKTDIALTGAAGWGSVPVAFSNGNGSFNVTNQSVGDFAAWAARPGAAKLTGDFNGDGFTDIAISGILGAGGAANTTDGETLPVALAVGGGAFHVITPWVGQFARMAADPEAVKLAGDFDGDGDTDIALIGPPEWTSIPVAFSNGIDTFHPTIEYVGVFAQRASHLRMTKLVGDFNGDRKSDILLIGAPGATVMYVAYSNGDGTFWPSAIQGADFAQWAAHPQAKKLTGDFNDDGWTDVALTGPAGWNTVPVLLSNPGGSYQVSNLYVGDFAAWSASPRAIPLVGNFNGGPSDIALTGTAGWASLPVALSGGSSFDVHNPNVGGFAYWSSLAGAAKLVGDFNGDGLSDVALSGVSGWGSVPVAFSNGLPNLVSLNSGGGNAAIGGGNIGTGPGQYWVPPSLTFTVTNASIVDFAVWAAMP